MGQQGGNRLSPALCLFICDSNSFIKHLRHFFQQGLHSRRHSFKEDHTGARHTDKNTKITIGSNPPVPEQTAGEHWGLAAHPTAPGRAEVVHRESYHTFSGGKSAWPQVTGSAWICSGLIDQVGTGCTLFERDYAPELALLPSLLSFCKQWEYGETDLGKQRLDA